MNSSFKTFLLAAFFAALFAVEAPAQVTRYKGFSAGAAIKNQYPLGDWYDYASANLGLSLFGEYTLPDLLPNDLDWGASVRFDYDHTFPKGGSTLLKYEGLTMSAGLWIRIPFDIKGHTLALQPELSYGFNFAFAKGKEGTDVKSLYCSQAFCLAPALRYAAPVEALKDIEFEFSPLWTIMPQKGNVIQTFGFRLGAVWHFGTFGKKAGGAE